MAINTTPDSYTKFLVHSDTTNGSTTLIDSSATAHSVVTNGDPAHSTSQAKFGSTAIHCDDTADGFGAAAHADFNLTDDDWTLDLWWYPTSIESENYFLHTTGGWSMLCLYYPSNNGWKVIHNNPTSWQTAVQGGAGTLTANEFHHIAFVRANHYYTIYLDGAIVAGPTQDIRPLTNSTTTLSASGYMAGNITGYVDEYRLSVGIARWTAAFTPPTKPYTITSPGSIMASNIEDDGSNNTSFGTNIITRSDINEASTDSVFSTSAKDGTVLMDVRADGIIAKPLNPAISGQLGSGATFSTSATFATYNPGSGGGVNRGITHANTSAGWTTSYGDRQHFVVPVAGAYFTHWTDGVNGNGVDTNVRLNLHINSTMVMRLDHVYGHSDWAQLSGTAVVNLSANDQISWSVDCRSSNSQVLDGGVWGYFSIFLIG